MEDSEWQGADSPDQADSRLTLLTSLHLEEDEVEDKDPDPSNSACTSKTPEALSRGSSSKRKLTDYFKTNNNSDTGDKDKQENDTASDVVLIESNEARPADEIQQGQDTEINISEEDLKIITGPAIIWQFYIRLDKTRAKCKACDAIRSTPTGTTTTLQDHLKKHHGRFKEFQRLSQLKKNFLNNAKGKKKETNTIKKCFVNKLYMDSKSARAVAITHQIALWICRNLHPYSVVDEEEFIKLVELLEPRYKVPCRTTFSRSVIPKLYLKLKSIAADYLKLIKGKLESISLTTDLWTSNTAKDSYIGLTAQFIDTNWDLIKLSVECDHFPGIHDGQAILKKVENLCEEQLGLKENDLDQPTVYITADNGSNMAAALSQPSIRKQNDPKVAAVLKKKRWWNHIKCMNHTLQLAINDARKEMDAKTVIDKVQNLAVRYARSKTARECLERFQQEHNLPRHEIIFYCETRWNSEYLMLARFLEQKAAITSELAFACEENLPVQDWRMIEGFVQVLKPIFENTAPLGSSKEVTFSTVIPVLNETTTSLHEFIMKAPKGSGILFARKLLAKVEERFPHESYAENEFYQIGMIIDPRFKDLLVSSYENDRTGHLLLESQALDKYREHIRRGIIVPNDAEGPPLPVQSSASKSTGTVGSVKKARFSQIARLTKDRTETSIATTDTMARITAEVEAYLATPTIDEDKDPLEWWRENAEKFPMLLPVAKHYLGLAPTEVDSERVFSVGGNTCTKKRSNLLPDHLKEIIYIHDNYNTLMMLAKKYNLK
ncbi:E3 SUMO-protein ligase ZBED1 [Frankliniella fusca]|uniref:E3 SUMO-protein ligase ZBED1 n=1 Tax=Frankliniella fusca TaxID=407009 RepID=A0AAE1H9T0_9NEOP|nr:E3 SUMO-protein ligase ZBED1 [Frankliniella fusca]